ncbi:sensor histidine kinase [Anaerosacchariphilus polymeriproducens]|uniref:histidine kinase n=1 Tax=Anaerosacchariphilus polymeriproducens TaxID=1812858 RepID=A0A371AT15_9FIRM|nr:sensor histidine kinase [Anaerosacchariphilus polymeriproducens]RDU22708.1 sensor histidine kinase [Anaerosacchariphilus polymeriproducens]
MKQRIKNYLIHFIKSYQKKSIQFNISISFSIIAAICMGFISIALYTRYVDSTESIIIEDNKKLINQASMNMETYIRSMMRISDTMYYSVIKNADLSQENLNRDMNLIYEANKDNVISIVCFTEQGDLAGATPVSTLKEDLNVKNQEWFVSANTTIENLHFSTPHVQNLFKDSNYRYYWVVSLSRAVELTSAGKTSRGVLLVDMDYSSIQQLFEKINSTGVGYTYLINRNGEIIYHPRQELIYSNLYQENNLKAAKYEDGNYVEKFHNQDREVIVKTVGYTGWKIVNVTLTSEFSMNYEQMRYFVIMIAAISFLLLICVNLVISSIIANPIMQLERSVKGLENGNLDLDIYIGGSYEIQHLGRTISYAVAQMRKLMDDMVKEQEAKRKNELDALQSQINPHFLYNTLDSIVWMVESGRYEEAVSMVTSLASLFRISISKGKNIISIQDEVAHAKYYLDIQKVRYKNKFSVEFQIEEEIYQFSTIKLIIQPILENAIYYAMESMDGEGEICIKGYRMKDDIYIDIIDNGLGMSKEQVELLLTNDRRVRKKGSGIGLINVHQRIQLYFGKNYGLLIESEPDEGTIVHIHLPQVCYDGGK